MSKLPQVSGKIQLLQDEKDSACLLNPHYSRVTALAASFGFSDDQELMVTDGKREVFYGG